MSHSLRILLLTLVLFVSWGHEADVRAGEVPNLLTPLTKAQASAPAGTRSAVRAPIAERMAVAVDFSVVDPAGSGPLEIAVILPEQTITIRRQAIERRGSDAGYTWRGTVQGSELSSVVLTVDREVIFGSIDFDGRSYSLVTENGTYVITRKDPSRRGPLADDTLRPPVPTTPAAARAFTAQAKAVGVAPAEDGSRIDLLILYTPELQGVYGAGTGVLTKIQHFVDLANAGYSNSGVSTRLDLVAALLYDDPAVVEQPDANSAEAALYHITDSQEVAALRDRYQADLISLLRAYDETRSDAGFSPSCGVGYIMTSPLVGADFAGSAFSVVEVKDIPPGVGAYCDDTTLAHELGHNMGCSHDRDHTYYGTDRDSLTFDGAYRYSYGYDVPGLFGTIMSYDGPTITYFSTQLRSYQGQPIGMADLWPDGSVQPDSADNARTINNTRVIVANFRSSNPQCAGSPAITVPATDPDGAYTVRWEASPTGGVSYRLEEATDKGFTSGVRTAYSGPDLSAPITGRTIGSVYYYRVQATKSGYADSDWTTGAKGCAVKISLAAAVDSTGLSWSTGGNAKWFGQKRVRQHDGDSAQSGGISDSQATWMQTRVTGPGTVIFQWRANSEQGSDLLRFTVDGVESPEVPAISGKVGWTPVKVKILSEGSHFLRWTYAKDYAVAEFNDAGWIDHVRWVPFCATPDWIEVPLSSPDGAITVSWGASATPGVSYVLQQATDSTFTTGLRTVHRGAALSVSRQGLVAGRTYFYRVKATKSGYTYSAWLAGANGCARL